MNALEMKMTTDLAAVLPQQIGFNFEELKAELTQRLEHYNNLVVTEDAIQAAKTDRASLRKLSSTIDDRRKEVEKQWNAPLTTFKAQAKELATLIGEPVAAIDKQIKAFEESEKAKKRTEVEAAYAEIVPENLQDIIPLDRILDQKWLNKTTSMKAIRAALADKCERVSVDMKLLDGVNPKYMAAVRAKYIETLDINKAMKHQDDLADADARFQAQEEARQRRLAQNATQQSQIPTSAEKPPVAVQEPVRASVGDPAPQPAASEKLYSVKLALRLTMAQANALEQFLTGNNIAYTKI